MMERSENEALWEKLRQAWWENRSLEEQLQRLQAQLQKTADTDRAEIGRVEEKLRMPMGKAIGGVVYCFERITRHRTHDVRQCYVMASPTRTSSTPPEIIQVAKENSWKEALAAAEKWLAQAAFEKPKEPSQEELEPLCFHVQR